MNSPGVIQSKAKDLKKYLYGLYLLIALLLLLLPLIIGHFFKKNYEHTLQVLSTNTHIQLKLLSYDQGWFTSQATIATNFPLTDTPLPSQNISNKNALILTQTIYHGPIMLPLKAGKFFRLGLVHIDSFFDPKHYFAEIEINYAGQLQGTLKLPHFSTQPLQSGPSYSVTNLRGTFLLSPGEQKFDCVIACEWLSANINQPRTIHNFATKHNLQKTPYGFWIGTSEYHFDQLTWQQAERNYSFRDFDTNLASQWNNEKITYHINSNMSQASQNNVPYGSQSISFTIDNMDPNSWRDLKEAALTNHNHSRFTKFNQVYKLLIQQLNKGVTLNINSLALNTSAGKVNATATLACPCEQEAHDLSQVFSHMTSKVHATLPIQLMKTGLIDFFQLYSNLDQKHAQQLTESAMAEWLQAGWLVTTGVNAQIDIK